jgi:hypothetical protein
MESDVAQLVFRELTLADWPQVPPEVVNGFPLVVLLVFPWPDLFSSMVEAGIATTGGRPGFLCWDCYYGVPISMGQSEDLQRGHCVLGCSRSYCCSFARRAADGADRFFVHYAALFFGSKVSPEVLAATTQRILTLSEDAFDCWLEGEMDRILFGPNEAGRAWLLRVQLSLRSR